MAVLLKKKSEDLEDIEDSLEALKEPEGVTWTIGTSSGGEYYLIDPNKEWANEMAKESQRYVDETIIKALKKNKA